MLAVVHDICLVTSNHMEPPPKLCIPANPDISGIGIRVAIYTQNLLCFLPVGLYLWDKKISPDELAGIRDQSIGMLAIAFSILITTIILAKGAGGEPTISNFHTAIVLSLSWMNNTSTWIWFILFAHHRSTVDYKPTLATLEDWRNLLWSSVAVFLREEKGEGEQTSIQRSSLRLWGFVRRLFRLITATPVLTLGSIHLSLMSAIGIWLWLYPAKFGKPILYDPTATLTVIGVSVPFSSGPLRIFSLAMYSLLLIPGINLLPPFFFFLGLHICYNWSRERHGYYWNPLDEAFGIAFKSIWGSFRRYIARKRSDEEAHPHSASNPNVSTSRLSTNSNHPEHQYPPSARVGQSAESRGVRTAFLVAGLVCLVAINVVFIVDIELTLHRNRSNQTGGEDEWGFGQVLALLLLVVPLRDAWNALRNIRNNLQQRFEQTFRTAAEAKLPEETEEDLRRLVKEGAKAQKPISGRFANLLQLAAYHNKVYLVEFLLKEIAVNTEAHGGDYGTALQAAAARGHIDVVQLLVKNGAAMDLIRGDYGTALCAAVANGKNDVVELLLKKGANVKVNGLPFGPALHVAVLMGDEGMVNLLLGNNPERADCEWTDFGTVVDVAGWLQNRTLFDLLQGKGLRGRFYDEERDYRYRYYYDRLNQRQKDLYQLTQRDRSVI